jgi:hypothetical protein
MGGARRLVLGLSAFAVVVVLGGCQSGGDPAVDRAATATPDPAAIAGGHVHTHEGAAALPPAGDGTTRYEIGYTMRQLRLPRQAGTPDRVSFVIEDYRGRPQTAFLPEQTKLMHVYVVRDDLAVFRHVHPEMRPDGRWVGTLTLPEPGAYRVVAEFMAADEGGDGDFVMLGGRVAVPGRWQPQPAPEPDGTASDWGVEATVVGDVTAGGDGELRVRLTTPAGGYPRLGQYLGTSAHLTGFRVDTGEAVHMHPLGTPTPADDAVELTFHSMLPRAGDYVLFLQVSVDGFLHTLPLAVSAS